MRISTNGRGLSAVAVACTCVSAAALMTGAPAPARACTSSSFSSGGGSSSSGSSSDCITSQRVGITGQIQRQETRENVNLISNRIGAIMGSNIVISDRAKRADMEVTGISAGDPQRELSAWATYSGSRLKNDFELLKSRTALHSGILGGDIKVSENILAGVTLSFQGSETSNMVTDGSITSTGMNFTPYGAVSFLDNRVVLDLMLGIGSSSTETLRGKASSNIKGRYGSTNWMAATHATYNYPVNDLLLSAKLGWMSTHNRSDGFKEGDGTYNLSRNADVGEASLGGRAAYSMGAFQPYIGVTYSYDPVLKPADPVSTSTFASTQNLSRQQLDALVGLNWQASDRAVVSAEVSNMYARSHEGNITGSLTGRYTF